MKIAMAVEGKILESNVCMSFGRAPQFLFYDTQSGEAKFLPNTAADSQGGAGIKAAQILVDNKAEALLAYRCGENAAEVMQAAGIKLYMAIPGTAKENIEAFQGGKLNPLAEIHPGFHGQGES